jgi:hypothetical protein
MLSKEIIPFYADYESNTKPVNTKCTVTGHQGTWYIQVSLRSIFTKLKICLSVLQINYDT